MKKSIIEYLKKTLPKADDSWLTQKDAKDIKFDKNAFFNESLAFYPGSGHDGQLIKILNQAGVCCNYLYVDYGYNQNQLISELKSNKDGFLGYEPISFTPVTKQEISDGIHIPSVPIEPRRINFYPSNKESIFGLMVIFQRLNELPAEHGLFRFAILFLCADGFATYDALFCSLKDRKPKPLIMLLEDYGFGGNYDKFGAGGLLEKIAKSADIIPEYLLVGHAEPWSGFSVVNDVEYDIGGMHSYKRILYKRNN